MKRTLVLGGLVAGVVLAAALFFIFDPGPTGPGWNIWAEYSSEDVVTVAKAPSLHTDHVLAPEPGTIHLSAGYEGDVDTTDTPLVFHLGADANLSVSLEVRGSTRPVADMAATCDTRKNETTPGDTRLGTLSPEIGPDGRSCEFVLHLEEGLSGDGFEIVWDVTLMDDPEDAYPLRFRVSGID